MSQKQERIFVVQKHAASHLHYDFRLEINGVLKSWAVPKGPSMNAKEKRLAVQVDDHDLGYANFEGKIPEGHYGAGQVIVWDKGKWVCDGDPAKQFRQGILKFALHGKKLKGKFHLIRMKDKQWLLVKESDREALSVSITQKRPESVLSGKGIEEV